LIVVVAEPTLIVPLRAVPLLAATLYPTAPLPEPAAPDVIVIHDESLTAVQLQDAVLATLTKPVLEPAAALTMVGSTRNEHTLGAAWLIVTVAKPTLMVPLRAGPVFTAAVKPMLALPDPAGDVMVIQGTFVVAIHGHVAASSTDSGPALAAGTSRTGGLKA
jgi:hypothetical protein